jgi:high-affinity iron transporter
MTATLIIVFREVFEISLVLSILMAATRDLAGRTLWISSGVAAGIVGALVVAAFAQAIAMAAAGVGQELFNAAILFTAVAMLGWHNVWIARNGVAIAYETGNAARSIGNRERPIWTLAVIAAVATVREGAEVVLFLHGIAASQNAGSLAMLTGGVAGLFFGSLLGVALYFSLIRLSSRALFAMTSWLILFLAAGMASEAAKFLV